MKLLLISSVLVVAALGSPIQEESFQAIIDIVNQSGAKWKAGHNFNEHTKISSLKRLLGVKKDTNLRLTLRERHPILDSEIPDQFDARDNWPKCASIRHIRDQGNCGSCWAVAAAGAFTDRACIASDGKFTLPLSQEELMTCCEECGNGCDGGDPASAWRYFATNGIVTGGDYKSNEGCQPYEIYNCSHHVKAELPSCDKYPEPPTPKCQKKCTNKFYQTSFGSDHHKVHSAYRVANDEKEIQKEIMAHGPVEADFNVYSDFMVYQSGIYHHVTGSFLAGHAVKIIGWGTENGTPYWLVANQWNDTWGEKGLFRILRGQNECQFEADVVAGVPIV